MAGEGVPDLAAKLNRLFETVPRPGGGLYTNEAAAKALSAVGVTVSAQHLWHLRTGKRDNPFFPPAGGSRAALRSPAERLLRPRRGGSDRR